MQGLGSGAWDSLGSRATGLGRRVVQKLGFRARELGFRVYGLGCIVP